MRPRLLLGLYLVLTLAPLLFVVAGGLPPRSAWDEVATAAGIVAFAAILIEFVLSGRFRAVSGGIGMDVTMRLHQLLARSALGLAMVHPFLYRSMGQPVVPWDPTRQTTVAFDLASLWTGVIAWVLLAVLVLMAIWRDKLPYKYETWRFLHGLFALAVAGLVLHHALSAGRYSGQDALLVFWVVLTAVAAFSLAWVYLLKPAAQWRRRWSVASVRKLADRTWEMVLRPHGHDGIAYEAGQFAWINVGKSPFRLHENPFSIASAPGEGRDLRFVIKELGDFTRTIGTIPAGTIAYVDGPHGNLVISDRAADGIALIAGGVGIAPLLSMLTQLQLDADPRPVTLVYGNRLATQIVDADVLHRRAQAGTLRFVPVVSEPDEGWTGRVGLVDRALIRDLFSSPAAASWIYVLCGPPQMMEEVETALIALGVPSDRILLERFTYD